MRGVIERAYVAKEEINGAEAALQQALKLFVLSSAFHTTSSAGWRTEQRPPAESMAFHGRSASVRPLRAVVILFLAGGVDSYNVLVPHSGCEAVNKDMYAEYAQVHVLLSSIK